MKSKGKEDLTDVTFVIPVKFDHNDRFRNLEIILEYLNYNFETNVIVGEMDQIKKGDFLTSSKCRYLYYYNDEPLFHRTKLLNLLYSKCDTDIIVNYDSDVVFDIKNYISAYKLIKNNKADIVYPFSGRFCDVNNECIGKIKKYLNVESIKNLPHHVRNPKSVGGCIFCRRDSLMSIGGENENFIAWGPEDLERYHRFKMFGLRIKRLMGGLFHLTHYKGEDSNKYNPYFRSNNLEYEKIRYMSLNELTEYIKTINSCTDRFLLEDIPISY